MADNYEIIGKVIQQVMAGYGQQVFSDPRRAAAFMADSITDSSLSSEKNLLMKVLATGALSFVGTVRTAAYMEERGKAFIVLTEREFIAAPLAEKVLSYFDYAFGFEIKRPEPIQAAPQVRRNLSPVEMLLDPDNNDNVVLYGEKGEAVEFEQIALIPLAGKTYVILRPVAAMPGLASDEALVFAIEKVDGEDCLLIEENDSVVDQVFDSYYDMLRQAGIL